jgi:predicted DNA-binding protein
VGICYHMVVGRTQTLVQLSDGLLAALDQYSAATGRSRSELIRLAIERYLDEVLAQETDRRVVEGYERIPQEPDPWAEAVAKESIAAEPW